ncbi:[Ribosomal protein S18]-alanine N-acetyltransferase [Brevundimonas sp. NIBR10]|nr:[Ribosomal protein S18]-alanine N-acetyltransferase [Brevundimonas sp. NIBR10]
MRTNGGSLGLATPADADTLAAVHAEAFDHPWDEAAIADLLGQAGVFGIAATGGFILCRVVLDEAEILTLAVRPDARRRGLARRLVEAGGAMARSAGAERLFLEVAEDNVAARGLYADAGFVETGRRRAYYETAQGRTDALILVLNLCGDASHDAPAALS